MKPSAEAAIGVILRVTDPNDRDRVSVGVFGDRAESTVRAAKFLRDEFSDLAARVSDEPYVVVFTMKGPGLDCLEITYRGTGAAAGSGAPRA